VHPACRIDRFARLLIVVPIAEHDEIAARQQFVGDTARHYAAFGIDDLGLDMRHRAPDRRDPAFERVVGRGDETRWTRLGHAVADDDLAEMHPVDRPPHDLDRTGAARHDPGTQARQIEFAELRVVHRGDEHRRHAVHRGAALGV
jgi:hypothetical protein